ncbi:hypothetical protein IEC97_27565 [Neobacillus cucumis]|uniref:hypothetical protein n=1 Tax=Neobacillus cucumis TaxID=1740721 RepID=UPI0018E060F2|nr:hypothetical protein [Neobacillus cucumis]MBI0581076.1 hypothetical protein [Neobacillus cucumis]
MAPKIINAPSGFIKAGTCVSVLYIETDPKNIDPRFCKTFNNQTYCVHNGRLVTDYRQGETQVFIRHGKYFKKGKGPHDPGEIVDELRLLKQVQEIAVIKGESPCNLPPQNQPIQQTTKLYPNWCGAFAYREGKNIRVSNGKYLYYTPTSKGERKCFLDSKDLKSSYVIYYLHYNIHQESPTTKPHLSIEAELVTRKNVVAVIGLSSLP